MLIDTLGLTAALRRVNERILLYLLAARGPAAIPDLFDGLEPRWADEAADRLILSGEIRETRGRLEVVRRASAG